MFRARMKAIYMLTTMLGLAVGSFAQAPRTIAEKLCDQLAQAEVNRDLNRTLSFYDSSYVGTDVRGKRVAFAEFRRLLEQNFPLSRNVHKNTTVKDVQLQAGRMVVYWKTESNYQYFYQRNWTPMISTGSGETTWENKGGQWKIVETTTFRWENQIDPEWLQHQAQMRIKAAEAAGRVDDALSGGRIRH